MCTVAVAKAYFKVIKCTLIILGIYNFVGDRYYFYSCSLQKE